MYAAVGSYVCQAWRRFDLRITGDRPHATACVAGLVYLNFFTSHVTRDVRLVLALALLLVTRRAWVHFTVGRRRVAAVKAYEGRLYGAACDLTVLRAYDAPLELLPQRSSLPATPGSRSAKEPVGAT